MPTEIKKEYLHLFETRSAHDAARTRSSESYFEPWTAYTVANKSVSYNLPPYDYSQDYLTFRALESGTFTLTIPSYVNTTYLTSVSYSLDNGETWTTTNNTSSKVTITTPTVQTGGTVLWKGSGSAMSINSTSNRYSYFSSTGNYSASGNIMSLLYGDVFSGESALSVNYAFAYLFVTNKLVDASNMVLPATELTSNCYRTMFSGCSQMTEAPELPATTLASNCYYTMFYNCRALATAPTLPATTMVDYCYFGMFNGCAALTEAPELPATTLASNCYSAMFNNCTSLTTAPVLANTELASYCYSGMFYGCTSLTTAPALPATTLADGCYQSMFQGCTSLATAPLLPATTLAAGCYRAMFGHCTALTTAPELPITTLVNDCYYQMFIGCTALTTAPALPATTLANGCYRYMFEDCTSLTTAPALAATTLAEDCYSGMFYNCSALTTAPTLPATTLVSGCYYYMFQDCTNLNYIKAMFTTEPSTTYTNNWVYGVAASGTFVKNSAAEWNVTGVNGVPSGWTVQTATS